MKRLLMLGIIGVLLAAFAPRSFASVNYNSSKSNTGNIVISYNPNQVTKAQAAAILADLEKSGPSAGEPDVRAVLTKQGVTNDSIKSIVIIPAGNGKGSTILLLADPVDEKAARDAVNRPSSRSNTSHN
jgi:hypothetical protein